MSIADKTPMRARLTHPWPIHTLLPAHIQDLLRQAASIESNYPIGESLNRRIAVDDALHRAYKAYPKLFKEAPGVAYAEAKK